MWLEPAVGFVFFKKGAKDMRDEEILRASAWQVWPVA